MRVVTCQRGEKSLSDDALSVEFEPPLLATNIGHSLVAPKANGGFGENLGASE
jgi:hypothetical protein